jgi:hypothetical protein
VSFSAEMVFLLGQNGTFAQTLVNLENQTYLFSPALKIRIVKQTANAAMGWHFLWIFIVKNIVRYTNFS